MDWNYRHENDLSYLTVKKSALELLPWMICYLLDALILIINIFCFMQKKNSSFQKKGKNGYFLVFMKLEGDINARLRKCILISIRLWMRC